MKVIWTPQLGEKWIFPRLLQKCKKPLVAIVVLTFLQNHDTCVKIEGAVSSLECFGQKPLSIFINSSFIAQKHHLSETYPDVWNKGFVEMKRNEGDKRLLNSWENSWK